MGKIHDALERAEQERKRADVPPEGVPAASHSFNEPARAPVGPARGERQRSARRSRVMMAEGDSRVTGEYRSLRARIQSIRRTRTVESIVVTSALAGEGKTTTAVNLAFCFGLERDGRTCLVDADLRTPCVHHAFFETAPAGLAEILETDTKLDDALIRVSDSRLSVLTVKALPSRPSELLASRSMSALLTELKSRFDTVIIDSPPVLGLPDATTLVDLCDSMLLVVGAGHASRSDIDAALERVDSSKAIGCVFNGSREALDFYGTKPGSGY